MATSLHPSASSSPPKQSLSPERITPSPIPPSQTPIPFTDLPSRVRELIRHSPCFQASTFSLHFQTPLHRWRDYSEDDWAPFGMQRDHTRSTGTSIRRDTGPLPPSDADGIGRSYGTVRTAWLPPLGIPGCRRILWVENCLSSSCPPPCSKWWATGVAPGELEGERRSTRCWRGLDDRKGGGRTRFARRVSGYTAVWRDEDS
jgi:hypothetical protein